MIDSNNNKVTLGIEEQLLMPFFYLHILFALTQRFFGYFEIQPKLFENL
jgi:hypothetical protein